LGDARLESALLGRLIGIHLVLEAGRKRRTLRVRDRLLAVADGAVREVGVAR